MALAVGTMAAAVGYCYYGGGYGYRRYGWYGRLGALGDSDAAIGRRTSGAPCDQSSRLGVISDDSSRASVGQASLCANRKWNEQSNVCGRAGPSFP